jgi:hypothetical protein
MINLQIYVNLITYKKIYYKYELEDEDEEDELEASEVDEQFVRILFFLFASSSSV